MTNDNPREMALNPALTPFSHGSDKLKPTLRPRAATRTLIAELGLRYRPGDPAALETHDLKLELLGQDLADIPVKRLKVAIERWIATSPYLPKASDLIELARKAVMAEVGQVIAAPDRLAALRSSVPEWNRKLYLERPDLIGWSEWRLDDTGHAYIHDFSGVERWNLGYRDARAQRPPDEVTGP